MKLAQFNDFVSTVTATLALETSGERLISLKFEHGALADLHSEPLTDMPQRFELVGSSPWLEPMTTIADEFPVRVRDLLDAVAVYEHITRRLGIESLNPNHIYFEGIYPVHGFPGRFEIVWGS